MHAGPLVEQHKKLFTAEKQGKHPVVVLPSRLATPCRRYRIARLVPGATAVVGMKVADRIRHWASSLDLAVIRLTSSLAKIPLLAGLHREVTADVEILGGAGHAEIQLRVRFRSPYLSLPLQIEQSQIGSVGENGRLRPAAFRFFDWHTWRRWLRNRPALPSTPSTTM